MHIGLPYLWDTVLSTQQRLRSYKLHLLTWIRNVSRTLYQHHHLCQQLRGLWERVFKWTLR